MQYLNEIILITILFTAVIDSGGNLKLSYVGTYNCFTCTAGIYIWEKTKWTRSLNSMVVEHDSLSKWIPYNAKETSYNHVLFFLCLSLVERESRKRTEAFCFLAFETVLLTAFLTLFLFIIYSYCKCFGLENGNLSVACRKPVGNLSADSWPTV